MLEKEKYDLELKKSTDKKKDVDNSQLLENQR